MKNINLWATAICSALFVVIVCVAQHNWELLELYVATIAIWMLGAWFWYHRFDLSHDLKVLKRCESPLKCKWIGTLVFFALVVLSILTLVIWGLWALGSWTLNLV